MNVKAIIAYVGLWLAGLVMMGLVGYVGLGLYGALFNVQEDDATWNCHVMGDMTCGEKEPWHGFTNQFRHADAN